MPDLTESQRAVLAFIRANTAPTYADVMRAMGWKSPQAVYGHVKALRKKGLVAEKGRLRIVGSDPVREAIERAAVIAEAYPFGQVIAEEIRRMISTEGGQ